MDATPASSRSPAGPAGPTATPAALPFPAILKPTDGCGSIGIQRIDRPDDIPWQSICQPMRLEELIPGLPASVAVLCGLPEGVGSLSPKETFHSAEPFSAKDSRPLGSAAAKDSRPPYAPRQAACYSLPACQQLLSTDGRFTYLGGRLPLTPSLDARARRLAEAAVRALPQPHGYLGVDLVLGEAADGSLDRVIEINPRLTTSYVALRAASETNLAAAMLAAAAGHHPDLRWRCDQIEFTADGTIARHPHTKGRQSKSRGLHG